MTFKTKQLYPTSAFPSMVATAGMSNLDDGVPLVWLENLVKETKSRITLAGESPDSAKVFGFENLKVLYIDEQTTMETMQNQLETQNVSLDKVKAILSKPVVTPDDIQAIRSLLGVTVKAEVPVAPVVPKPPVAPVVPVVV